MGKLYRNEGSLTTTHARHAAHATKLREVLLGSLVLLILINPLVEVGLEEMETLLLLEKTGPVLFLEILLLELDLDVLGGVVDLALGGVDIGIELEVDVVLALERLGGTGEGEGVGLEVQLDVILRDVRDRDGQVDEVLAGIGGRGALSPEDCSKEHQVSKEDSIVRWLRPVSFVARCALLRQACRRANTAAFDK